MSGSKTARPRPRGPSPSRGSNEMSEYSGYTVRQLLPPTFRRMDEAMKIAMREDPAFQSKQPPGVALAVAGDRATQAVCQALDCDVFELIAKAWAKALELR